MSLKLKRVLAVLVLIALVFGWYVTLFGIGDKTKDDAITSVKSALKYGLDIDGGVYVVMEAKTDLTGDELKKLQSFPCSISIICAKAQRRRRNPFNRLSAVTLRKVPRCLQEAA